MFRAGVVSLGSVGEGGGGGRCLGEEVMCSRVSPAFAVAQVRDA